VPHLTIALDPDRGPIVRLFVAVSAPRAAALKSAGATVPQPIWVDFLIDTGASCTAVDAATIAPLGLSPTWKHVRHDADHGRTGRNEAPI
jgi:hypothetical protein